MSLFEISDNSSNNHSDRDKADISIEPKEVNNEDSIENQGNEDTDITRRKRRRSSAGNE